MLLSSFKRIASHEVTSDQAASGPFPAAMSCSESVGPQPLPLVVALPVIAGMSLLLWAGIGKLLALLS